MRASQYSRSLSSDGSRAMTQRLMGGIFLLVVCLGGCGRRAPLDAPEGETPPYPRTYPAPERLPEAL